MKIPPSPPDVGQLLEHMVSGKDGAAGLKRLLSAGIGPATDKGRYEHWDRLRHLNPPAGLSSEEWWTAIKLARRSIYKVLPLKDKYGRPFVFAMTDQAARMLHQIDRDAAGQLRMPEPIATPQTRDAYLVRSLIEEAIRSSQLEGASTTRRVAKEMLRQGRKPRDRSEQMIYNNYRAMHFIRESRRETLSPALVLALHRIVTEDTLEDPGDAGRLRKSSDDIHVFNAEQTEILHTPPAAAELAERLETLCRFTGGADDEAFIHPVIRAVLLHFGLAYDHPFVDGNGRTARALFYWSIAHQDYWLMEYISISRVFRQAPAQYGRAFLYTETDDNDATYFILHHLEAILKAIEDLHRYLERKTQEVQTAERLLRSSSDLQGRLNHRQKALLRHALKNPHAEYRIEEHRKFHGISYQTARTDLLMLVGFGLLDKEQLGKAFVFIVPPDLDERIEKGGGGRN